MKRRFLGLCMAALMLTLFPFETVQASPRFASKEITLDYHELPLRSAFPGPEIGISKSSDTSSRQFFSRTYGSAEEFRVRLDFYKNEFKSINSGSLLKKYFDLMDRQKLIAQERQRRGEGFFSSMMNDESVQLSAIDSILTERSKLGDIEATFGSSVIWYLGCEKMVEIKLDASAFCEKAVDGLRRTAQNNDPRAYVLLGSMHEKGIWYEKSNFVAAENYFFAAQIYDNLGDRDRTLINIEKATRLWPNNPRFIDFLSRISK